MNKKEKKKLDLNEMAKMSKNIKITNLKNNCLKIYIEFNFAENMEVYVNENMEYHRDDGPARIIYYKSNDRIKEISYFKNGYYHREEGPAISKYRSNGTLCEESYKMYGYSHRIDGPAYITYYENMQHMMDIYYLFGEKYDFTDDFRFSVYTASFVDEEDEIWKIKLLQ